MTTSIATTATTSSTKVASSRRWLASIVAAIAVTTWAAGARAAPAVSPRPPSSEAEPEAEPEPEPQTKAETEAQPEPEPEPEAESETDASPEAGAPPDEAGDAEPGPAAEADASPDAEPSTAAAPEPAPETSPAPATKTSKAPPSPRGIRTVATRIAVGVGLSPEAPGTKAERALVEKLKRSLSASTDPPADVRHISVGSGDPRTICRERRDDLVVMIGYLPEREDPVVLAHDCRLDRSLGVRSSVAANEHGLLGALWEEHDELVRQGVRERRTIRRLSPTARGVIIGVVAVAVVGTAIGLLVANALRDERVVVTVSP